MMIKNGNAKTSPASVFNTPYHIINDHHLTKAEKVELLHRWAYDELEICVAEEENMCPQNSLEDHHILDDIVAALHTMGEELKLSENVPTKAGA
jgi:hypothetical protein